MKKSDYKIGYTGTYIQDHKFEHLCSIPFAAALSWVKSACPDISMGNRIMARDLIIGDSTDNDASINDWLNKLFIIVANDHDKWIALVNWDGRFSIYIER